MDTETLSFRALRLHDWRQYGSIELLFHERLMVITGANAAGKDDPARSIRIPFWLESSICWNSGEA